jgi:Magnesium chelatase, subunit ChlI
MIVVKVVGQEPPRIMKAISAEVTGSMIRNLLAKHAGRWRRPLNQHEEELEQSQIYGELQLFGTDRATQGPCSQGMALAAVECGDQEAKSMVARRLTTIVPTMTLTAAIETTCIHRVAGLPAPAPRWSRRARVAPRTRRAPI